MGAAVFVVPAKRRDLVAHALCTNVRPEVKSNSDFVAALGFDNITNKDLLLFLEETHAAAVACRGVQGAISVVFCGPASDPAMVVEGQLYQARLCVTGPQGRPARRGLV